MGKEVTTRKVTTSSKISRKTDRGRKIVKITKVVTTTTIVVSRDISRSRSPSPCASKVTSDMSGPSASNTSSMSGNPTDENDVTMETDGGSRPAAQDDVRPAAQDNVSNQAGAGVSVDTDHGTPGCLAKFWDSTRTIKDKILSIKQNKKGHNLFISYSGMYEMTVRHVVARLCLSTKHPLTPWFLQNHGTGSNQYAIEKALKETELVLLFLTADLKDIKKKYFWHAELHTIAQNGTEVIPVILEEENYMTVPVIDQILGDTHQHFFLKNFPDEKLDGELEDLKFDVKEQMKNILERRRNNIQGNSSSNNSNLVVNWRLQMSPVIGRYCNTSAQTVSIESSFRIMTVKVITDGSVSGRGFQASYHFNLPAGVLPLRGNIPDMTSDSLRYVALQTVYCQQAEAEAALVSTHLQHILESLGRVGAR